MSYMYALPSHTALGDYPFKGVIMSAFGTDYDRDIVTLTDRVNNNAGFGCAILVTARCYRTDEVEKIISAYVNLVKKRIVPEYAPTLGTSTVQIIERRVADAAGVIQGRAAAVLYQLYYGTKDGSIKLDRLLSPLQAARNESVRETDEASVNTGGTSKLVRYAVPLAIGAVAIYGLSQITLLSSNVKQLFK